MHVHRIRLPPFLPQMLSLLFVAGIINAIPCIRVFVNAHIHQYMHTHPNANVGVVVDVFARTYKLDDGLTKVANVRALERTLCLDSFSLRLLLDCLTRRNTLTHPNVWLCSFDSDDNEICAPYCLQPFNTPSIMNAK